MAKARSTSPQAAVELDCEAEWLWRLYQSLPAEVMPPPQPPLSGDTASGRPAARARRRRRRAG